ncbi:MAG: four helix bundle protein [Planctomycetes bacterium]|nr:four helix bundle protein [Planctomycetota bacterium]
MRQKEEGGRRKEEGSTAPPFDLRARTTQYSLRLLRLYSAIPRRPDAQVLGNQLIRSGTSVGAHYREAQRARSASEFLSKITVAHQELDETDYWLELLAESGLMPCERLAPLRQETQELLAIITTIIRKRKRTAADAEDSP